MFLILGNMHVLHHQPYFLATQALIFCSRVIVVQGRKGSGGFELGSKPY